MPSLRKVLGRDSPPENTISVAATSSSFSKTLQGDSIGGHPMLSFRSGIARADRFAVGSTDCLAGRRRTVEGMD